MFVKSPRESPTACERLEAAGMDLFDQIEMLTAGAPGGHGMGPGIPPREEIAAILCRVAGRTSMKA